LLRPLPSVGQESARVRFNHFSSAMFLVGAIADEIGSGRRDRETVNVLDPASGRTLLHILRTELHNRHKRRIAKRGKLRGVCAWGKWEELHKVVRLMQPK
jgi:hypothetical protein